MDILNPERRIASIAVPGQTEPKLMQGLEIKSINQPEASSKKNPRNVQRAFNVLQQQIEEAEIDELSYGLYSTKEIDELSVFTVTNGDPSGPCSVRDPRLGPHNESQSCETCGLDFRTCYGHMASVRIPLMPHPMLLQHILLILQCVCNSCGGLLVTAQDLIAEGIHKMVGIKLLLAIRDLVKKISKGCRRYANVQGVNQCATMPYYDSLSKREKGTGRGDGSKNEKEYIFFYRLSPDSPDKFPRTPENVLDIFKLISDSDAILLGFNPALTRPYYMIIERLIIVPYCVRPDLRQDDTILQDDLTSMYLNICSAAKKWARPNAHQDEKDILMSSIYFEISHMFRNKEGKYTQGNVKSYSDITTRLQGKKGLIRYHIMGKRVNHAGRTVLSPGGELFIFQLGVPQAIANKMTRPIMVNAVNRSELQARYDANRVKYITPGGGKYVGNRIMITQNFIKENPNYKLELGDIVERILENGDIGLFNRQPTLQKQNLIAVELVIGPYRTFRLNLSLTTPQNADFDGDEGNLHIPQTIEAYTEAAYLFSVQNSIMSGQTNRPMIGVVMNALTASRLMTKDENTPNNRDRWHQLRDNFREYLKTILHGDKTELEYLDEVKNNSYLYENRMDRLTQLYAPDVHNELSLLKKKLGILKPDVFDQIMITVSSSDYYDTLKERCLQQGQIWLSARAAISGTFPAGFYYNKKGVVIQDGILMNGVLNKETLGNKNGSIVAEMYKSVSPTDTVMFLSYIQFVTNTWLEEYQGFTIGIDDCLPDNEELEAEVEGITKNAFLEVEKLYRTVPRTEIQRETQERKIVGELNVMKNTASTIIKKYVPEDNAFRIMGDVEEGGSGAKGSKVNFVQIGGFMGQVQIGGARSKSFLPGERVLPTFRPYDTDPCSRGFVKSNFLKGLTMNEIVFQSMAAREGVINTAITTADTGSLQHRLSKANEDAVVVDGSVEIADGSIIEFLYGDTSISPDEETTVEIGGEAYPFFRNIEQLAFKYNSMYGYV